MSWSIKLSGYGCFSKWLHLYRHSIVEIVDRFSNLFLQDASTHRQKWGGMLHTVCNLISRRVSQNHQFQFYSLCTFKGVSAPSTTGTVWPVLNEETHWRLSRMRNIWFELQIVYYSHTRPNEINIRNSTPYSFELCKKKSGIILESWCQELWTFNNRLPVRFIDDKMSKLSKLSRFGLLVPFDISSKLFYDFDISKNELS